VRAWQLLADILERGDQKRLAFDLHISPTLISLWCLPPHREGGTGEYSPLERTVDVVESLRRNENPHAETIVRWLCEQLGYMPALRVPAGTKQVAGLAEVAALIRETGEFLGATADASADGRFDLAELLRMRAELSDVQAATVALAASLDTEIRRLEDEAVCERTGRFAGVRR